MPRSTRTQLTPSALRPTPRPYVPASRGVDLATQLNTPSAPAALASTPASAATGAGPASAARLTSPYTSPSQLLGPELTAAQDLAPRYMTPALQGSTSAATDLAGRMTAQAASPTLAALEAPAAGAAAATGVRGWLGLPAAGEGSGALAAFGAAAKPVIGRGVLGLGAANLLGQYVTTGDSALDQFLEGATAGGIAGSAAGAGVFSPEFAAVGALAGGAGNVLRNILFHDPPPALTQATQVFSTLASSLPTNIQQVIAQHGQQLKAQGATDEQVLTTLLPLVQQLSDEQFNTQLASAQSANSPASQPFSPEEVLQLQAMASRAFTPLAQSSRTNGQLTSAMYSDLANQLGQGGSGGLSPQTASAARILAQQSTASANAVSDAYRAQIQAFPLAQQLNAQIAAQNQLQQQAMYQQQGGTSTSDLASLLASAGG